MVLNSGSCPSGLIMFISTASQYCLPTPALRCATSILKPFLVALAAPRCSWLAAGQLSADSAFGAPRQGWRMARVWVRGGRSQGLRQESRVKSAESKGA